MYGCSPRTWNQGDVWIRDLVVSDSSVRPWLQVLGKPTWHNLQIEAQVTTSNPQGCTQMLDPNRSKWIGASGLSVRCNTQ